MAGLIAGRDAAIPPGKEDEEADHYFVGAAPGARIVSIKVAASDGATDVSQVIAAIDWIVQHRNSDGLNIRVLNLSFGTDGTQDYQLDPLAYAAEVAWHHGIVVVVAAGNSGFGTPQLNNPAYDPYVIAVGGDDTRGTDDPKDDVIPSWQSRGNALRHPDLVAPGKSIISLRDPGSFVDEANPGARVGASRFIKGSGSSQAAAIVSGAVATILEQHPELTPDQVKALLMQTAVPLPNADPVAQGAGLINLHRAREAKLSTVADAVQTWPRSTGLGSLQLARGSVVTEDDGTSSRRADDLRRYLGCRDLGGEQLGRDELVGEIGPPGRGRETAGVARAGARVRGPLAPGAVRHGRPGRGAEGRGRLAPGADPAGRQARGARTTLLVPVLGRLGKHHLGD